MRAQRREHVCVAVHKVLGGRYLHFELRAPEICLKVHNAAHASMVASKSKSTFDDQKALRLNENLNLEVVGLARIYSWRCTKCSVCHEICTSRITKGRGCHGSCISWHIMIHIPQRCQCVLQQKPSKPAPVMHQRPPPRPHATKPALQSKTARISCVCHDK